MKVVETDVKDVRVFELDIFEDERGYFLMFWDRNKGFGFIPDRVAISFNKKSFTLRGMHFQLPPYDEEKFVMCSQGAIWDVVIDLRKNSPTYKSWIAFLLWSENFAKSKDEAFQKVLKIAEKNGVNLPSHGKGVSNLFVCEKASAVFVPKGFAHGFLTLTPRTKVFYLLTNKFAPSHYRGVRWNDPTFNIVWPAKPKVITERDNTYPDWQEQEKEINL